MNKSQSRISRPFSISIGVLVLVSAALAWTPVGAAVSDMLVDAKVIAMPGDTENGQAKRYYQARWDTTLTQGYPGSIVVQPVQNTQELRIETVTVSIEVPVGQIPSARISTYNPDGTTTALWLSLENQGVYFVNGQGRVRYVGTHAISAVSKAGNQIPQVTKFDWGVSRSGSTSGNMHVNMSVTGYATPVPPVAG